MLRVFDRLLGSGLAVTVAVPVAGCLMAVDGTVDDLRGTTDELFVDVGTASVRMLASQVTEAWVVRPRHGAATVELYDRAGRCALVIGQGRGRDPVTAARWEHLTAMLSID